MGIKAIALKGTNNARGSKAMWDRTVVGIITNNTPANLMAKVGTTSKSDVKQKEKKP